jgi:hypothetical protein
MRDQDTQSKNKILQSCSALLQFSGILIFISLIVMSADFPLFLLSLSIFMTTIAMVFGSKRHRIIGAFLILISLAPWKRSFEYVVERSLRTRARDQDAVSMEISEVEGRYCAARVLFPRHAGAPP